MTYSLKVILIFSLLFLARGLDEDNTQFPQLPQLPGLPFPFGQQEQQPIEVDAKGVLEIDSIGNWELISENAGVSAMHINLLPTNKIILYDAKIYRISRLKLPEGMPCIPFKDNDQDKLDCFAHAVEYDIETNQVRPLQVRLIFFLLLGQNLDTVLYI